MKPPQDTRLHRKAICIICRALDQPNNMVPVTDWTGAIALAHPHHHGVDTVRITREKEALT